MGGESVRGTPKHVHTHTYTRINARAHMHTCTHERTCTHTHTHTQTHTKLQNFLNQNIAQSPALLLTQAKVIIVCKSTTYGHLAQAPSWLLVWTSSPSSLPQKTLPAPGPPDLAGGLRIAGDGEHGLNTHIHTHTHTVTVTDTHTQTHRHTHTSLYQLYVHNLIL